MNLYAIGHTNFFDSKTEVRFLCGENDFEAMLQCYHFYFGECADDSHLHSIDDIQQAFFDADESVSIPYLVN